MASNAPYLEQCLDGLESLPSKVEKNYKMITKFDTLAQEVLKTIDIKSDEYLKNHSSYTAEEKKARLDHIQGLYKKVKSYSDDKIQLAAQTYEMIDKHVRRLVTDTARFEADMEGKTLDPHLSELDPNSKKKKRKILERVEKKKDRLSHFSDDDAGTSGWKEKDSVQPELPEISTLAIASESDVPVDPNEPTYCFCHQVSYGKMVACDNPDCPIEWFHFACVGLISKPKGKWYCSQCSTNRKKK